MRNGRKIRIMIGCSLLLAALGVVAGMTKYAATRPAPTAANQAVPDTAAPPAAESALPHAPANAEPDEHRRTLVVGTWEDDYQGKRTMTLNADGTGTMTVELSGIQATLFADRLQFDMVWSLEDGRLKKRTIGGQPERQVNMILKLMGDSVDEPILELTNDRLLLLDKDGVTRYDWRKQTVP